MQICESTISLATKASNEIDFVRVFMKSEFNKHHKSRVDQSMSEVKQNHSHHYNLGVKDDGDSGGVDTCCGHVHDDRCNECDRVILFLDSCYEAIEGLRQQKELTKIQMDNLIGRMDTCAERYMYYVGYQIRLVSIRRAQRVEGRPNSGSDGNRLGHEMAQHALQREDGRVVRQERSVLARRQGFFL